jgi:NADPH-dependent FMN reductase
MFSTGDMRLPYAGLQVLARGMKKLLIVWHSMTGGSEALARAAAMGAEGDVELWLRHANATQPDTMLGADGYIFAFPENLAAISGVMKAFFDRCYYPCLGQIEGRPYALIVCAGSDGSNAIRQAERIATGWRLKKVADSILVCTNAQTPEAILAPKTIAQADLQKARDTGATLASGLMLGIF